MRSLNCLCVLAVFLSLLRFAPAFAVEGSQLVLVQTESFGDVGGGFAGTCAATTAARLGLSVALIQDRPVLGGTGMMTGEIVGMAAAFCEAQSGTPRLVFKSHLSDLKAPMQRGAGQATNSSLDQGAR